MTTNTNKPVLVGWAVCGLGILFYCFEYLLRIEPSVMVPELMKSFNIDAGQFGLLASLYYFAYTPTQAIVGIATDKYGPRKILTFAALVCTLGSLLFGLTDNVYIAATARFMIGFGSAFAFVGALKLAVVWLPKRHFALFAGLTTALAMVGAMAGNVELSVMAHNIGWKQTILVGTVFGVILTPLIWFFVRGKGQSSDMKDLSFKDSFAGLWHAIRERNMWLTGFIGAMLFMSLSVFAELWGNDFLTARLHVSVPDVAMTTSMVFLGWLVGAPFFGWLSDKLYRRKALVVFGCFAAAAIFAVLLYTPNLTLWQVRGLLFLFAVCCSAEVVCFAIGRDLSLLNNEGAAVAFINMLIMLGGMLFQPLVGYLLDWFWQGGLRDGVHVYTTGTFTTALSIIPIGLVLGGIAALVLHESHPERV